MNKLLNAVLVINNKGELTYHTLGESLIISLVIGCHSSSLSAVVLIISMSPSTKTHPLCPF